MSAPKVWLDYDQAALDKQYNSRGSVPDVTMYLRDYAERTQAARAQLACTESLAYGPGVHDKLDIYPAPQAGAPVMVFLHGGDWRALSKEDSGFVAPALVAAGVTAVVPDFDLIPDTTIEAMGAQVRRVLAWVHRHIASHGGDPQRIFIAGHSSGANLVSQLLTTRWPEDFALPADLIKGAVFISGLGDLEPVRRSFRNAHLKLDEAMVASTSLLACPRAPSDCPLLVMVAEQENDEYKRQGQAVAQYWADLGRPSRLLALAGCNHFNGVLAWLEPEGPAFQATLAMMGLRPQAEPAALNAPN